MSFSQDGSSVQCKLSHEWKHFHSGSPKPKTLTHVSTCKVSVLRWNFHVNSPRILNPRRDHKPGLLLGAVRSDGVRTLPTLPVLELRREREGSVVRTEGLGFGAGGGGGVPEDLACKIPYVLVFCPGPMLGDFGFRACGNPKLRFWGRSLLERVLRFWTSGL